MDISQGSRGEIPERESQATVIWDSKKGRLTSMDMPPTSRIFIIFFKIHNAELNELPSLPPVLSCVCVYVCVSEVLCFVLLNKLAVSFRILYSRRIEGKPSPSIILLVG